ncbi:hypothetical protein EYF80_023676 [Liparis tanakae]|uniref:Uncharacterized protein n=1 Tax=Liparis tanakae TaxID=230148 RepID=A0A4Z2HJQ1_9TELE|nr:hypothetical protein EYF80_023676 [Liparis tanakae]
MELRVLRLLPSVTTMAEGKRDSRLWLWSSPPGDTCWSPDWLVTMALLLWWLMVVEEPHTDTLFVTEQRQTVFALGSRFFPEPFVPDPGVEGRSLLCFHGRAFVEVLGEVRLVQPCDVHNLPLGDVVLLHDRRGVVVVPVLGALVPGDLALVVAVGERVEDGLRVHVHPVHFAALRRSGGHGQVLQFYSKARRTGVHIIQGLDQNIFGNSRVQQGAEELLLQRCQLGYHWCGEFAAADTCSEKLLHFPVEGEDGATLLVVNIDSGIEATATLSGCTGGQTCYRYGIR